MDRIFLSHSSGDSAFADAFIQYLYNIGINVDDRLFYTKQDLGVPIGEDVIGTLHSELTECRLVILLLSSNYYRSAICMNEMGAAWILNKKIVPILIENLENENIKGVIGINKQFLKIEKESLNTLSELLRNHIQINSKRSSNAIEKARDELLEMHKKYHSDLIEKKELHSQKCPTSGQVIKTTKQMDKQTNNLDKFINLSFDDADKLFANYIIDTKNVKYKTGWKIEQELKEINSWEKNNLIFDDLFNNEGPLSIAYPKVLKKFEYHKIISISHYSSHGNPTEYTIDEECFFGLLDINEKSKTELNRVLTKYQKEIIDMMPF